MEIIEPCWSDITLPAAIQTRDDLSYNRDKYDDHPAENQFNFEVGNVDCSSWKCAGDRLTN